MFRVLLLFFKLHLVQGQMRGKQLNKASIRLSLYTSVFLCIYVCRETLFRCFLIGKNDKFMIKIDRGVDFLDQGVVFSRAMFVFAYMNVDYVIIKGLVVSH